MRRSLLAFLIVAVGCADDPDESSGSDQSFCGAVEEFLTGIAELGRAPSPGFPISEEDQRAIADFNREASRLAEPLKDSAPGELRAAFDTFAGADPTDPAAMRAPAYQDAEAEVAAYIETECGIDTEIEVP